MTSKEIRGERVHLRCGKRPAQFWGTTRLWGRALQKRFFVCHQPPGCFRSPGFGDRNRLAARVESQQQETAPWIVRLSREDGEGRHERGGQVCGLRKKSRERIIGGDTQGDFSESRCHSRLERSLKNQFRRARFAGLCCVKCERSCRQPGCTRKEQKWLSCPP